MSVRAALLTWAALAALLALTVALAYVPMGAGNLVASLGIAALKTALIVLVYMKLWRGRALDQLAFAALVVWLAILIGLSFLDYLTRGG